MGPYGAENHDPQESVWFDNNGLFSAGKTKAPKTFTKLNKDQAVAIILNLDEKSPHANTVSIFRDGVRACKPRKLPEPWRFRPWAHGRVEPVKRRSDPGEYLDIS
eukprot:s40_g23.t1